MSLQHLKLEKINEAELSRLIADGVAEDKTLEYKRTLEFVTDHQKQELLSDITALANGDGGDIIYGLDADKGVAKELMGLSNFVPDDIIGSIENLLRDSVQPRLQTVEFNPITLSTGKHALVLRVRRSLASPHMVRHKGVTRFCGRNSNGKYDLDVHELRSAFVANETYADRLRAFRLDRVNRLATGSAPVVMAGQHLLVLHLLPVLGARSDVKISTSDFERLRGANILRPIGCNGWSHSFNFDGFQVADQDPEGRIESYVQVMRNGFLEAVTSRILDTRFEQGGKILSVIPSIAWERLLLQSVGNFLAAMRELNMPLPYVLSLSLLNVKGYTMYVNPIYSMGRAHAVDRDHLLTEEILIETPNSNVAALLRPLFDQVWNACGFRGSLNYDESGNWREC
jgi:hypothetical protein